MPHWREQILLGAMSDIITVPETGEDICYGDLLVGRPRLSPRQGEAFDLICLQGYTETAAAAIMLPNSKWSTTVQQHVNAALERMVAYYDEHQSGVHRIIKRWRILMSMHPIVKTHLEEALNAARQDLVADNQRLSAEEQQIRAARAKNKAALDQVDQMLREDTPSPDEEPAAAAEPAAVDDEPAA